MPYYGIYIPSKGGAATAGSGASTSTNLNSNGGGGVNNNSNEKNAAESPYVFHAKIEALEMLKLYKDGRLREFNTRDDAYKYVQTGCEVVQTKYFDVKTSTAAVEKAAFRGPTKHELIDFRKAIESGNYEGVKTMIWDNPRYLVSSGDTPTTLKEGTRYNAMHIVAISKKPQIGDLILKTVSDPKFVDLLTGKKNDIKMCKELCANLLDYYLNMPEKGRSETPLHLAAKIGCLEVIEVLISYPACKMTLNKDGQLPRDIICSRVSNSTSELHKKIECLLEERFYVPVLRSTDNVVPPQIGEPFSANNPPNFNSDPLSPEVKIQALAGPMSKEQATKFCRRWKTPPRVGSNITSPLVNNAYISPIKIRSNMNTPVKGFVTNDGTPASLKRRALFAATPPNSPITKMVTDDENLIDKQNGNHKYTENLEIATSIEEMSVEKEKNNNEQQQQEQQVHFPVVNKSHGSMLRAALCPKTPLLVTKQEAFFTYREQYAPSPVALDISMNNSFLPERGIYDTPGYTERHIKLTDTEKGLEMLGRELAKENNVDWREYWDFLDSFINITSDEGLQRFENYLAQRLKQKELNNKTAKAVGSCPLVLDDVCNALEKLGISKNGNNYATQNGFSSERNSENNSAAANMASTATTPYTCVEKSLQVFAKRMTKTIIHNVDNVVSINDTLLSELKRLKSLICSFKEDTRFLDVEFSKVHSRIANLISIYLDNSQEISMTMTKKIKGIMQNLLLTPGERREHIECICLRIKYLLDNSVQQIQPENLKTEAICAKVWHDEADCKCQWESNLSRKTSRRNRMEARYRSNQSKLSDKSLPKTAEFPQQASGEQLLQNSSTENDSSDDLEYEDVFWSDYSADSEDADEWFTPPDSLSRCSIMDESDDGQPKIYIYGDEPSKRDLDVLNAIFHIDIDKTLYPNIDTWKNTLMRHSNEEMDYAQNVTKQNVQIKKLSSPQLHYTSQTSQSPQLPTQKRLFMSPSLSNKAPQKQNLPLRTPINKLRGLFSTFRENVDSTPMSSASSISSLSPDTFSVDDTKSLSLLNMSTPE
ncbi:uncharacterized protein LOC119670977 isoform X2 [Teleopsis dalmanni]|uniref:uncharacterized protein LOC119670977 isoform X2 n=1 Tax=Teleopsis dalmanni TaxID=139649 RepID=UPI0018CF94F2|nr:uncharacterized protein LOC119670977 isoform X2 [Teleopsis dalmanni]